MTRRLQSIRLAIVTRPDRSAWWRCLALYLCFLAVALPLGLLTGFLRTAPVRDSPWLVLGAPLYLLVRPALLEEFVFRVLLLPHPSEHRSRSSVLGQSILAGLAFVAIHPINGMFFHDPPLLVFVDPVFLTLAALLGAVCIGAYLTSGSIWPPVILHWLTVTVWILFLGGGGKLGWSVGD